MRSYVLIEAVIGKARAVAEALKRLSVVSEVHLITGPYDIIAVVEAGNYPDVQGVTSAIHATPGVARTVTCLPVDMTNWAQSG